MFGYLDIEKDKLEEGKRGLWQSFMCGMCFSTKKQLGNIPRAFISNDVNFFNVLFHSVLNVDVNVEQKRCISSPIKKRSILVPTELCDKMSVANIILAYWNLYDDVVDGASVGKKTAFRTLKRAYNRARLLMPELDQMVESRYNELRQMEQSGRAGLDQVAHSFAQLTEDFAATVLQQRATGHVRTLCYNLGKWIYLIDALDDVTKDIKKGNYNPFVACYGISKADQLQDKFEELQFLMYAVLNRVAISYNDLSLVKYNCILNNVLYDSIRNKTKQILERYKPSTDADRQSNNLSETK